MPYRPSHCALKALGNGFFSRESSLNLKAFRLVSYSDHGVRRLTLAGPGTIQSIQPNRGVTGLDHKGLLLLQRDASYLACLSFPVLYFWG